MSIFRRSALLRRAAVAAFLVCACERTDEVTEPANVRPTGRPCEVSDVRVDQRPEYVPPSGRPLPLPKTGAEGGIAGATGQFVTLPETPQAQLAMRLTATSDVTVTFKGDHDLARMASIAFLVWPAPPRVMQAFVRAKQGEQVWESAPSAPVRANESEGFLQFRLPLPAPAVQAAQVEQIDLVLTGDVAGELGVEVPVFEWILAPSWKALLDVDGATPRAIELSNGTRAGFGLVPGRVLRAKAKLVGDGGELFFAHSSIEPARGKPTLAYFGIMVRHPDGRIGQARVKLETRGKWRESSVPFEGKRGETVDIAIDFVVEGPASLCAVITSPEVFVD